MVPQPLQLTPQLYQKTTVGDAELLHPLTQSPNVKEIAVVEVLSSTH